MRMFKNAIAPILMIGFSLFPSFASASEIVIGNDIINFKYNEVRDISCSIDNINIDMGSIRQFKLYKYQTSITGNCSNDLIINIYPANDSINNIEISKDAKLNIKTGNSKYFVNNDDGTKCKEGNDLTGKDKSQGCHISIPIKKGGAFSIPVAFNVSAVGKNLDNIKKVAGVIPVKVMVTLNE